MGRRAVALLLTALLALAVAQPAQGAERRPVAPRAETLAGVAMWGDSMTVTAQPYLDRYYPGWRIDALWGRGVTQLPVRVQAYRDTYAREPKVAIIALGTNQEAGWSQAKYQAVVDSFPAKTRVVFVNTYRPALPVPEDGTTYSQWMTNVAANRPRTLVVNWRSAAYSNPSYLSEDRLHQSVPEGADAWGALVVAQVRRVLTLWPEPVSRRG